MSLTTEDVTAILGPVDGTLIAEIVLTDASRDELARAWAWLNSEDALINAGQPPPSGKVAELIDLLSDQAEDEP
jgi:hypothetical protein